VIGIVESVAVSFFELNRLRDFCPGINIRKCCRLLLLLLLLDLLLDDFGEQNIAILIVMLGSLGLQFAGVTMIKEVVYWGGSIIGGHQATEVHWADFGLGFGFFKRIRG